MKVKLNKAILKDIDNGYLKAETLVKYLMDQGFKSNECLKHTSIKDLYYNGSSVVSAVIREDVIVIELIEPEDNIFLIKGRKNAKERYFNYKTRPYCINKHNVILKFSLLDNGKKWFQFATLDFDNKEYNRIVDFINK